MAINPIALQTKAADFGGALNTLAAVRQLQAAGQQRQMNELAIQEAQRKQAENQALSKALSQYDIGTPEGLNALRRIGPKGFEYASAVEKMRQEAQTAKKSALKTDLDLFSKAAGGLADSPENYSFLYQGAIKDNPELASYLPSPQQYQPGLMQRLSVGPEAMFRRETSQAENVARLKAAEMTAAGAREAARLKAGAPKVVGDSIFNPETGTFMQAPVAADTATEKPTKEIQNYNFYANQEKQFGRQPKSFEDWQKLNSASEIKPPSGYRVTKSGDLEAIPGGPADPKVFANKLTEKQKIEYKQSYDGAKKQLNNFVTSIDQNIALVDSLLANKEGLDAMFGGVYQYKPSMLMSDQTRQALGNYEQLIDKSVLTELTNLRLSSPTGGALGNVTDREGTRLESASAGLQRYLSKESAISRLNLYKKELELSKRNIEGAFNDTYSFLLDDQAQPSGLLTRKPLEPKGSGVDTSNPLLGD